MALGKQNVRTAYPMDNVIRIFFESRGEVKQILWVPVTLGALGTLRRPCLRSRPLAEEVSADEVPRRTREKISGTQDMKQTVKYIILSPVLHCFELL